MRSPLLAAVVVFPVFFNPANAETVYAGRGGTLAIVGLSGSLVCPDVMTLRMVFDRMEDDYARALAEKAWAKEGKLEILHAYRGLPHPIQLENFGCVLVPPGTRLEHSTPLLHVIGTMPDGTEINGQALLGTLQVSRPE